MTLPSKTFGTCCAIFRGCDVEIILATLALFLGIGILIGLLDKGP
jgi:hypothetical protein